MSLIKVTVSHTAWLHQNKNNIDSSSCYLRQLWHSSAASEQNTGSGCYTNQLWHKRAVSEQKALYLSKGKTQNKLTHILFVPFLIPKGGDTDCFPLCTWNVLGGGLGGNPLVVGWSHTLHPTQLTCYFVCLNSNCWPWISCEQHHSMM